jgi:transcriptional regulator with XRE-family HTH domain
MGVLIDKIRDAYAESGLNQGEFAKAVGVRQNSVSRWLKGKSVPSPSHLPALGPVLGLDLPTLLQMRTTETAERDAIRRAGVEGRPDSRGRRSTAPSMAPSSVEQLEQRIREVRRVLEGAVAELNDISVGLARRRRYE